MTNIIIIDTETGKKVSEESSQFGRLIEGASNVNGERPTAKYSPGELGRLGSIGFKSRILFPHLTDKGNSFRLCCLTTFPYALHATDRKVFGYAQIDGYVQRHTLEPNLKPKELAFLQISELAVYGAELFDGRDGRFDGGNLEELSFGSGNVHFAPTGILDYDAAIGSRFEIGKGPQYDNMMKELVGDITREQFRQLQKPHLLAFDKLLRGKNILIDLEEDIK